MTDLETPWATPEAVPTEAQWLDEGPFTQGGEAFVEESWAAETPLAETPLAETPVTEARTGERWPESPFETPVEGFLEEGATAQWESFSDTGTAAQGEGVPGCGGPVSGAPPLIYRTSSPDRSRNPWVGRAQTLLNVFLARQRAGTESCTDQTAATKSYIATLRPKLAALGQDPLGVDCVFGEGTETATLMFQACRALLRDGKIGERTWPELLALETAPPLPAPTPTPTPAPTPTPTPTGVRVREDVWTLSAANPWHPTLLWYARGVRALKALNGNIADPRAWAHLAATHGTDRAKSSWPPGAQWHQCEHNSWHFLPWHRAYLHHFETTMRATIVGLGGPSDWALPFWDYSDRTRPDVRRLPPAFREQSLPDGTANPLREEKRARGMNRNGRLSTEVVDTADMLLETVFTPAGGITTGFGGTRAPVGSHLGAGGSRFGTLERVPHAGVHTSVGGEEPDGLMTLFNTAALDPIFWLHHANIDRLWEAWLRHRSTNRNPTETAWLDARWSFGTDSTKSISTRAMLDPRQPPLGYRYSDMPGVPTPEAADEWAEETPLEAEDPGRPPELVGASEGEVSLGSRATTTRIRLGKPSGPSREALEASRGVPKDVKVYLRLDNVTATRIHASAVVVYVNVPPGGRPADFPDRRAGLLPMFGVIETSRRDDRHNGAGIGVTFDITRAARALATSGQWDPDKVDVTFVPVADSTGRVGSGDVKVGRVSVFYA